MIAAERRTSRQLERTAPLRFDSDKTRKPAVSATADVAGCCPIATADSYAVIQNSAHHANPIQPRQFLPKFEEFVPHHWCDGDAMLTHVLNTFTLLVPGNEGYYIRTLKSCMPRIADSAMRHTVRQFMLQEGQHGVGHHRHWQLLESQGYRIAGFHRRVDTLLYRVIEPLTPLELKLSMVACVEHVNAYLGHEFLAQEILKDAEPELRALFEWHFAEEIEHKHVVYDALQAVAPSYALRAVGAAVVLPMFYALMMLGAVNFLKQDKLLFKRSTWSSFARHLWSGHHMLRRTCGHLLAYLRPSFHPWQTDDRALAQSVIDRYSSSGNPLLHPLEDARAA